MDTSIPVEAKVMKLSFEKNLYRLLQLAAIDIKFSSKNPYLVQQQFADFHEQTQVIDDVLAQQGTSQNEALNLGQLNKDNNEGISEPNEHTREKVKQEKEDQIEIVSNITINREDATEEIETKKISYSEADYNRMIEAIDDLEVLVTLIKHKVIPEKYIAVNYIEKPILLWDFKQIEEVIVEIARELAQYKTTEPKYAESGNEIIFPITDYKKVNETIKILKETLEFNNILIHLLQLPELKKPNWNLFEYNHYDSD
ncbi:10946_t:CDS:2 [Gigaspora margarita]|uniref:10946_t:CDS:1 n=1 Tax=Gigaspora margarita TaxID=4874 RepID=A0ABN7UWB0_GIGMA|nr:10946_t:CDS:2 [Gigaspora margarita]